MRGLVMEREIDFVSSKSWQCLGFVCFIVEVIMLQDKHVFIAFVSIFILSLSPSVKTFSISLR